MFGCIIVCINGRMSYYAYYISTRKQVKEMVLQYSYGLLHQYAYSWIFFLIFSLFIIRSVMKHRQLELKKELFKNKDQNYIQNDKIIVAIEIVDFFVQYAPYVKHGWKQILIPSEQYFYLIRFVRNQFRIGYSYNELFLGKKIRQFLKELQNIQKIQLFLYTKLPREVGEEIIKNLKIQQFFPPKMRVYKGQGNHPEFKHAIDLDNNTRRVIIITPNRQDRENEEQNYFLFLSPKFKMQEKEKRSDQFLKRCEKTIKQIIESNEDIDYLHEELDELRADLD